MRWKWMLLVMGISLLAAAIMPPVYVTQTGSVSFSSDAPLELIEASSKRLQGAFDINKRTFAFRIPMNSFQGFNDPLQREHFCEKFLECSTYPNAIFQGKLIEDQNLTYEGSYELRAKGKLNVHGIERERILPIKLDISEEGLHIFATFSIKLADHDINIPQVVYQKIAQEIYVTVNADLALRNAE